MENGWIFVVVDSALEGYALVDIFDKDGKYLTRFETDISADRLSFNNGKAYAVATEGDYKFIKRYNFDKYLPKIKEMLEILPLFEEEEVLIEIEIK